ncbi:MAG TPA: hypothetical protein VH209_18580 [Steroidobacteraceae bacterium]|nr:hypothetical protein [Steroidobacteraceae bacterium]
MTRATRTSWKTLPIPAQRVPLEFAAAFNNAEAELLVTGLIPKGMEDKWFVYFEGPAHRHGWLLFHRSWTGACIYGLQLEGSPAGARVVDSWVSRDPAQYKGTDVDYDRKLLRFLIDAFLLRLPAVFPMPAGVESTPPGVYQHSVVGRAYPESPPPDSSFLPAQSQAK